MIEKHKEHCTCYECIALHSPDMGKIKPASPKIHIIEPNIMQFTNRYTGEEQNITDVVVKFERDITIYYGKDERGEYVALLPIKITYKRKINENPKK